MSLQRMFASVSTATLIACGGGVGTFGVGAHCEQEHTPVAWDEAAPDGSVAADLLAPIEGSYAALMTWDDGSTTALSLTAERTGTGAIWIDEALVVTDPEAGTSGITCEDPRLEFEVAYTFSTADGLFDETFQKGGRISAPPWDFGDRRRLEEEFQGSFSPNADELAFGYEHFDVDIEGQVGEGETSGSVTLWGFFRSEDEARDDELRVVGTWEP